MLLDPDYTGSPDGPVDLVYLPLMPHKDRVPYLIGGIWYEGNLLIKELHDVVEIPAFGESCITCNVADYVDFSNLTPLTGLFEETYNGDVCTTNHLKDNGYPAEDGSLDLKIGTVCAPLTLTVSNRNKVEIDIKPGAFPNTINLGSNGKIPLAIISSVDFSAPTEIDPSTITLADADVAVKGKSLDPIISIDDVNGDGLPDLIVHIDTKGLQVTGTDGVKAIMHAEGYPDEDDVIPNFKGEDSIRIVPPQ